VTDDDDDDDDELSTFVVVNCRAAVTDGMILVTDQLNAQILVS
jgi:hypothetical protein